MSSSKLEKALIGGRLRTLRERARVTLEEAATAAKVQPLAVEKWERGSSVPSLLELRPVLELYGAMPCQVLWENNPLELSPELAGELLKHSRQFSPALRARVDCFLAMVGTAVEPTWKSLTNDR